MTDARLQSVRLSSIMQGVDVLLLQNTDEYQSGNVHESRQRVRWLCGFSGSHALLVVCMEGKCKLFTDSRYTIQASLEVDQSLYDIYDVCEVPVLTWLEENLSSESVIGYYGELFTLGQIRKYNKLRLKMLSCSSLDELWVRPMVINQRIEKHSVEFAGSTSHEKRQIVSKNMKRSDAMLITDVDAISWLLNIRNMEFSYNPSVLSRAILYKDGKVDLFVDATDQVLEVEREVSVCATNSLPDVLKRLNNVSVDASTIPMSMFNLIKDKVSVVEDRDSCTLLKAVKNSTEISGMKKAHINDGVAVVNFLYWLNREIDLGNKITELDAVHKIKQFRLRQEMFLGESFETISSFGGNAAIVHYRVNENSNRVLEKDGIYLVDSGGQYYCGTTDITRTIPIGAPSDEQIVRFTMVLKGFLALGNAVFPIGTTGGMLDVLARQYLWREKLNYGHGTGHGVGSFLSVHEGPQAISVANNVELLPGMVLSNEPGYYKQDEYGIRIENMMYVEELGGGFLGFKQLTCVPICLNMIKLSMLNHEEIEYINGYHKFVYDTISPYLDVEVRNWLYKECRNL